MTTTDRRTERPRCAAGTLITGFVLWFGPWP
jgi:hypothetical protein